MPLVSWYLREAEARGTLHTGSCVGNKIHVLSLSTTRSRTRNDIEANETVLCTLMLQRTSGAVVYN
jgi:hypothetical protein